MLKSPCHEIFDLCFFFISEHPINPLFLAVQFFQILFQIREYVLFIRYAENSAICRIAENSGYADDQHIIANIFLIRKKFKTF
jgi:hypothetical protein